MEITHEMLEAMMKMMDEKLLNGNQNIWMDACEIARYGIAREILEAALKAKKD
jgi:hypothetical protein